MTSEKRTDSGLTQDFFCPDVTEALEDGQKVREESHELVQTSSHLMMWLLCYLHGCQVVRRSFVPKARLFGGVTYTTTWWLRY